MEDLSTAADPIDATSETYLGRWHRLVSTTNWEKGRIIHEWRQALIDAHAPAAEYSDDAWSRRVGGVSGQHVGRLRRVYERFGDVHQDYEGLYWSHFQAALDWNDAEMWLEGAIHNRWSVADMRRERWEAFGGAEGSRPRDSDIVVSEPDEDAIDVEWQPVSASENGVHLRVHDGEPAPPVTGRSGFTTDDAAIERDRRRERRTSTVDPDRPDGSEPIEATPVRPFADLPPLPDDLSEALEAFKLAILRHKSAGWQEVTCEAVVRYLDGLRALAMAPA